jgi:phage tail sheath protein FI
MDDKVKHLPSAFFAVSGATGQQFSLKWISGAVNLVSSYSDQTRLTEAQVNSMSTSIQMNSGSSFPASSGSSGFTGFFSVGNLENTSLAKFTLPIQNGFDGVDVRKVNPFDPANMGSTTAYETYAYRTAIDMLANADDVEITDLVLPGVYRDKVADYALAMVENRGDLFYIMDFSGSTVSDILADVSSRNVDSPFAATYYSSLILKDRRLNKNVEVPASTVMPAVFAYNDSVAFPWFAPAGFSRGGLARHGVQRAKDKLQKSERDKLYDNRINPIGTFNSSGTVVWGQKTLQVADSARNRINVMRMILKLQKTLSPIALNIVFEPNLATTWDKFVQPATKELSKIRANFGIDEFKLILDSSTTTEDYIERNIIYGKLGIKPTRAAEFIWLDIIVSNNLFAFA